MVVAIWPLVIVMPVPALNAFLASVSEKYLFVVPSVKLSVVFVAKRVSNAELTLVLV